MTEQSKQFEFLEKKSTELRLLVLDAVNSAGKGHIGGAFSMMDMITSLFYGGHLSHDPDYPEWPERDIFLLSKGHAGIGLYSLLADRGFFSKEHLNEINQGGLLGEHPDINVPGIEIVSGSLGHAIGVAAGIAKADQLDGEDRAIIVLMGDGECYEGSVWEAALFAAHHALNRLAVIVDRNNLIATGSTEKVNSLGALSEKWSSFGWDVLEIDGHNFEEITMALNKWKRAASGRPLAIIANTIKGKGVSFMEGQVAWHHGGVHGEQYLKGRDELISALKRFD